MLRAHIRELVDFDYEETLTFRRAVEWYKEVIRATPDLGTITGEEREYMDKQWGSIVQALAESQQVPVGWLSYSLAELAQHELRLLATAERELQEATVD